MKEKEFQLVRKTKIGMGMICVSDSPNDIHVDYHDLFESIPE